MRDSDDEEEDEYMESEFKSPEQISHQLVTMSALPNSRWLNLLNLDVIKVRNVMLFCIHFFGKRETCQCLFLFPQPLVVGGLKFNFRGTGLHRHIFKERMTNFFARNDNVYMYINGHQHTLYHCLCEINQMRALCYISGYTVC